MIGVTFGMDKGHGCLILKLKLVRLCLDGAYILSGAGKQIYNKDPIW